jgi:hypothetical protein
MKWYKYLKSNDDKIGRALLDYEKFEDNNIIICQKLEYLTFGKFINYLDFAKHMIKNTPLHERCYYETIFGNSRQRPYFDIEFYTTRKEGEVYVPESEADESIRQLISIILEELNIIVNNNKDINALKNNKSHILVFTSHAEDKRSYHIVIEGYSVADFKQNKAFHDKIVEKYPEKWRAVIDHSMYKSLQQFRIVGNTKWKAKRVKTLNDTLTISYMDDNKWYPPAIPDSQEHQFVMLLESSLITFTSTCTPLQNFIIEDKNSLAKYIDRNGEETFYNPLTPDDIRDALALCYKFANLEFGDNRFPYSYLKTVESGVNSALILLKRHRPSNCSICNKLHDNENPYLIIAGENRDVYLDCRRNPDNKKLHVGNIGPALEINEDIKTPPKSLAPTIVMPKAPQFNPQDFINTSNSLFQKQVKTKEPEKMLVFKF